jgi:uncharacterized integral membrane protein
MTEGGGAAWRPRPSRSSSGDAVPLPPEARYRRTDLKPKLVLILIVAVLALIVLLQNTEVVTFHFLFWSKEISQIVLVVLTLALGFALGFIVAKFNRGN